MKYIIIARFTNSSILDWIVNRILFNVCSKHSVEKNNHPSKVFVNIFSISSMMSTMVRGRVKDVTPAVKSVHLNLGDFNYAA